MTTAKQGNSEDRLVVRTIFEVIGRPKEHVESTIKAYIENIKTDEEIKVNKEEYEAVEEVEDDMFSAICEVELDVANIEKLTWLCMNFSLQHP